MQGAAGGGFLGLFFGLAFLEFFPNLQKLLLVPDAHLQGLVHSVGDLMPEHFFLDGEVIFLLMNVPKKILMKIYSLVNRMHKRRFYSKRLN